MRIMHKKICGVLLLLLMSCGASAQDIEIRDFKENIRDLRASLNPVSDLSGEFCALIRFSVSDTTFVIEPNMGFIKRTTGPGEILLYVPTMARKLTIKHEGLLPLRGYKIPVKLEPKRVYLFCEIIRISIWMTNLLSHQFPFVQFLLHGITI